MATGQFNRVVRHLRTTALGQDGRMTDGQLLECFLSQRDEGAFEALLGRHGPMVLAVCRRVLGDSHDAEDAFQATFLIFVRKATAIRKRESVASWLHQAAYRAALAANAARRQSRERQVNVMPEPEAVVATDIWSDLRPLLDQELDRLPDKYRDAVVLCDLQGKTRREAARQLGVPVGTLSGRLTTAHRILAKRLSRHGVPLSVGSLATIVSQGAASACVPKSLIISTTQALTGVGARVPPAVAAIVEGVLKTMLFHKLRVVPVLLLATILTAIGIGNLAGPALVGQQPAPQKVAGAALIGQQQPAQKGKGPVSGKSPQDVPKWIILDDGGDGELTAHEYPKQTKPPKGYRWKERANLRHGEPVICLALTKDLIAVGGDGDITVWDVKTAKMRYKSPDGYGHAGGVAWLACSADGLWLFSGGITDGFQRTMDLTQADLSKDCLRTGPLGRFDREPTAKVIAHGPDPKTWVQADGKAVQVTEWETPEIKVGKAAVDQPRPQVVAGYEHDDTVRTAAFSDDGAFVATGGDDKTVRLWTIATNKQRAILRGHTDAVAFVALAGAKHAASVSKDGRAILWDVAAEKQKAMLVGERGIRCAAFSPGGRLLATGGDDGVVKVWDVAEGRQIATLKGHQAAVRSLAFHPEGRILASGSQDKTVKLWQLDD